MSLRSLLSSCSFFVIRYSGLHIHFCKQVVTVSKSSNLLKFVRHCQAQDLKKMLKAAISHLKIILKLKISDDVTRSKLELEMIKIFGIYGLFAVVSLDFFFSNCTTFFQI